jgi:MFS transporter, ACS family, D-galactonate transporter
MPEHRVPRRAWLIVALLFLFILINFADKAVIGIAGVPIMSELNLSPREFGLIGSSFFLLFSVSAIATGFIVNHVKTRWALLVMALIWALTQFPMAGTVSFETIVACRIVLGAAEGPAYPVALHATYKWFPNDLRMLPTAVISLGAGVGVLAALPLLNWVIVHYSWHWACAALGVMGLLWSAAWLVLGDEGPMSNSVVSGTVEGNARLPYRWLLFNPTIMSGWCAYFASYWGVSLLIAWQAPFLIKGLGFTQQSIGLLSTLPWGVVVILLLVGGWFSQHLLSRGVSSRMARGAFGGVCVVVGGIALLSVPQMPSSDLKIAATTIGIAAPTIISVVVPAIVGEITPLAQRSAMLAISNAIATSAGILAPYVMGSVVETAATPLAGFETGFVICGIIMIIGGAIGIGLMRPEREATRLSRDASPQSVG